jgi:hypothetical protein
MSEKDVKRLNGIVLNVEKDKWISCVRVKCKVMITRCDGGEGSIGGCLNRLIQHNVLRRDNLSHNV